MNKTKTNSSDPVDHVAIIERCTARLEMQDMEKDAVGIRRKRVKVRRLVKRIPELEVFIRQVADSQRLRQLKVEPFHLVEGEKTVMAAISIPTAGCVRVSFDRADIIKVTHAQWRGEQKRDMIEKYHTKFSGISITSAVGSLTACVAELIHRDNQRPKLPKDEDTKNT